MKKILSLVLACALLLGCAAFAEEAETAEQIEGKYVFVNATGEIVTNISIKDNVTANTISGCPEGGLLDGESTGEYSLFLPAGEDGSHRLTVTFTTESGREESFATLSYEEAEITLLATDAMTGATPIQFGPLPIIGSYVFVNKTGETVTNISIKDNVTGDAFSGCPEGGLKADEATGTISVFFRGEGDGSHQLTLTYTTESGREESFATLSYEDVTIELLAADAMTGATPIKFTIPAAE